MLAKNILAQEGTATSRVSPSISYPRVALAATRVSRFEPLISEMTEDGFEFIICCNYQELMTGFKLNTPDILVLGIVPELNSLEIYREFRKQWQDLPVILLINQPQVSDTFKKWANKKAISHVVSSYPQAFAQIRAAIIEVAEAVAQRRTTEISLPPPPSLEEIFSTPGMSAAVPKTIELDKAIVALNQLTEYSKRYFGPLVICNYWKKARNSVVETHPWLNQWSIDYSGKINYISHNSQPVELSLCQFQSLQVWTQGFLRECDRVVGYFTQMLQKKQLSPEVDRLISFIRYPQ